jgi:hypothetical protein
MENKKGSSIVEVILAMAIFSLIASTMVSFALGGFNALQQGGEQTQAEFLAGEAIEAIRSIKDDAWNDIIYNQTSLVTSSGRWFFTGEGVDETIGQYTRTIVFEDVCRDVLDDIVDCPGSYTDVHTKKVSSTVSWITGVGKTNEVERVVYITNWDSTDWAQTNWVGGSGQIIWSDETMFDSDDGNVDYGTTGEIKLASVAGSESCGTRTWSFDTPSNYAYDDTSIEVASSRASLLDQSTVGVCSGTPTSCNVFVDESSCTGQSGCSWGLGGSTSSNNNPNFDTDSLGWVYFDWDQGGGEVDVTGSYRSVGGNPGGFVDIDIPIGRQDEVGGFWQEAITTTADNPTATLSFDWQIELYDPTPNTFQLYVFVDSASGQPTIGQEVWSSGEITSTQGWNSQVDIDVGTNITTAGTYYIKVAVWVETGNFNTGPFTIGYDNVLLEWSSENLCSGTPNACNTFLDDISCGVQSGCSWSSSVSYPTDNPSINPTESYSATEVDTWSSFVENASKDGGEIYYQLSDDNGATWQYWDGADWITAGTTDYNTASTVNINISEFSTSTGQISFRAFLESDGSQLVELDEVDVSCSKKYDWPFDTPSNYTYNSASIEVASSLASLVNQGGSGACLGTPASCDTFVDGPSCSAQSGCSWGATGGASGSSNNTGFDTDASGWSYLDWGQSGGEVDATGSYRATGGNAGGFIDINIPTGRQDELGGFWEQTIITTEDNPTATISFDWFVGAYDPTPNTFQLYVFVDDNLGVPIIGQEVWSSGEITSTQDWASEIDIDIGSSMATAGTYYIKVAVWLETGNTNTGPFTIGYDNVVLNWSTEGVGTCSGVATSCSEFADESSCGNQSGCSWSTGTSYPIDVPSINPTSPYIATGVNYWSSFIETASKDGGEIYYQLSDDNGATWQYWSGADWVTAGASDYNTAIIVNANISEFSTSTGQISFRAFLESDGSQLVQLDNVRIAWGQEVGVGAYEPTGYFVSSAFDIGNASSIQVLEWDEVQPSGTDIQVQIRVAPDNAGSPGVWTSWYGAGGAGTYFTEPFGALIPNDLNNRQWMQYRVYLTGDGLSTPVLQEMRVNYK